MVESISHPSLVPTINPHAEDSVINSRHEEHAAEGNRNRFSHLDMTQKLFIEKAILQTQYSEKITINAKKINGVNKSRIDQIDHNSHNDQFNKLNRESSNQSIRGSIGEKFNSILGMFREIFKLKIKKNGIQDSHSQLLGRIFKDEDENENEN